MIYEKVCFSLGCDKKAFKDALSILKDVNYEIEVKTDTFHGQKVIINLGNKITSEIIKEIQLKVESFSVITEIYQNGVYLMDSL